jgi:hypothetical protein
MLAAGSVGAWAAGLEKSACNDLNGELAGVLATGARADMERGPEWAKANLTREKLGKIQRLIEIEEQLEFRCGMGRNRIAATSPESKQPAKRSEKVVIPEWPEKKPADKSSVINSAPAPAASPGLPAVAGNPALQRAAVAAPKTVTAEVPADVPDLGPTPSDTAAPNSAAVPKTAAAAVPADVPDLGPTPGSAAAPNAAAKAVAPTSPAAPKTAAAPGPAAPTAVAPKPSRRQSSATYVSPAEVNPFFVTRYGDAD